MRKIRKWQYCRRCKHQWPYGGKSRVLATCPQCSYKVKLRWD